MSLSRSNKLPLFIAMFSIIAIKYYKGVQSMKKKRKKQTPSEPVFQRVYLAPGVDMVLSEGDFVLINNKKDAVEMREVKVRREADGDLLYNVDYKGFPLSMSTPAPITRKDLEEIAVPEMLLYLRTFGVDIP